MLIRLRRPLSGSFYGLDGGLAYGDVLEVDEETAVRSCYSGLAEEVSSEASNRRYWAATVRDDRAICRRCATAIVARGEHSEAWDTRAVVRTRADGSEVRVWLRPEHERCIASASVSARGGDLLCL